MNNDLNLNNHTLSNDLLMWLSLLCTETVDDAIKLIKIFPALKEVFMDMQEYTTHPKEAMFAFSEALHILDVNTVNYMVDDMKAEIERQKAEVETKNNIIKELEIAKATESAAKDSIIKELKETIAALQSTINTLNTNLKS